MRVPISQVKAIMAQKKFLAQYYDPAYIYECNISLVGVQDSQVTGDERQDHCLVVRIRTKPPFNIPQKIDSVRVYTRISKQPYAL